LYVGSAEHRGRYQWHPAYMSLGLLAGTGAGCLWHRFAPGLRRMIGRAAALLLGVVIVGAVLPGLRETRSWVALQIGRLTPAEYNRQFEHGALSWNIGDARALADYVRANSTADDRVLVWSDPLVNS
jgi:hypothetical protein